MADDVMIRAEGLGKKYVIGHEAERERYTALRDVLARSARNLWRKTADLARGRAVVAGGTTEEFWALKDVSFEVKRGEVLGIIGRNGAGKSTLLKILSRITEPSEGRVTIKGRVASLLEVGTGFHPELTGRENIYLNGAILGMTRAEIRRKFDEIVAFAEVEKFLDTPVKRYSSGMYVRLAFAVAAHLEPEILVVDEVLAVGDADFQKKCLGKMSEVAGGGRTVLFVSHNMAAVQNLCSAVILLGRGRIVANGVARQVINSYLNPEKPFPEFARLCDPAKPTLINAHASLEGSPALKDTLFIQLIIAAPREVSLSIDIRIRDHSGIPIGFASLGALKSTTPIRLKPGSTEIEVGIGVNFLSSGSYYISVDLTNPFLEFFDRAEDCLRFEYVAEIKSGFTRVLQQNWGYGSVCFLIHLNHQYLIDLTEPKLVRSE